MHIYSSLGLTQNLSAQASSPIKKAQNQTLAETTNKLDAKPNNKTNTASFKDTLTLSKQTLGFKEIANKYDLTNASYEEVSTAADKLYESGLINREEHGTIASFAYVSFNKHTENLPAHILQKVNSNQNSEKSNFIEDMNQHLQFMLDSKKTNHQQIESMEKAIAVLDKLTALRG